MHKITILSVLLMISVCSSYKVLLVFPFPSSSHLILAKGYARHLLKAGHEVTLITPTLIKNPDKNLRQIDVSSNFQILKAMMQSAFDFEALLERIVDFSDIVPIFNFMHSIANNTLINRDVQKLMTDPDQNFDVVVAEWMYSELYSGLGPVFNCPLIWSSSMDVHGLILSLIDEDPNPAYTPDHMSTIDPPFTFWERFKELKTALYLKYLKWKTFDLNSKTYNQAYRPAMAKRGRELPSLYEAGYNASLVLGNSHVSTGQAIRLPQSYKPIAGYHMDEDATPLPENIQKIMDEANNGVIYFSMGTIMKSTTMPEVLKKGLLELFRGLKQTVIWKFEEKLPDTPKNVHIIDWAPQQSILAHPNCLMFITHGGLLSTTEALHYGVPIIGIPIFADQTINVVRAVRRGFAIHVPLGYDMHLHLKMAIEEMIENSSYRSTVKELSFAHHHRPAPPGAELVFWVEHVVRTRGAPHLRSPALAVPFYQKAYLDLALVVLIAVYSVKTLLNSICKSGKVKEKQS